MRPMNTSGGPHVTTGMAMAVLVALILGVSTLPAAAQRRGGPPDRGGGGSDDWRAQMRARFQRGGDRGRSDRGSSDRGRSDRGRSDSGRSRSPAGQSSSEDDKYPLVAKFDGDALRGFGIDPRSLGGQIVNLEARYDRRTLDRARSVMQRYDKNHNEILEHSEWAGVPWQDDPRDSDLDHDGQLTLAEMAERNAKRDAGNNSSNRSSSSSPRPPGQSDPGSRFGRRGGGDRGGDRGRDRGGDRGRDRGRDRGGDPGRGPGGFDPAQMLKRFDRNGDGTIDPNELDERTRRFAGGFLQRLGVDPDKPIRIDELAKRIQKERESRGDAAKKKATKVPERLAYKVEGAKAGEGRRSFRSKSPALPEKMPDWWGDRDKNRDGQVTLSEYLTSRTGKAAKAFRKFDVNNDGVVTSQEATLVQQGY